MYKYDLTFVVNLTSYVLLYSLTKGRVPDLDDLLRQVEMDELAETAHQQEGEQRTDFSADEDHFGDDDVTAQEHNEAGLEDSILDELLNESEDSDEEQDGDDHEE